MRTIISFDINSAKNEVCNSFIKYFLPHAQANEIIRQQMGAQLQELETTAQRFADCLQNHRFNIYTEKVVALDNWRDRKWTATKALLVSELDNPNAERRKAAETVLKLFDSFGKIRDMSYTEQSGAMSSLCTDLLNNHKPEVDLLGIESVVLDLQAANNDFGSAYEERTLSIAESKKGETREAKQAVCLAYRTLVFVVNAYIVMHGVEGLEEFVSYSNALIGQYRPASGQKPAPEDEGVLGDEVLEGTEGEEQEGVQGGGAQGGGSGTTGQKQVEWNYPDGRKEVQFYNVGEKIVPPEPPAGYIWNYHPNYMPDENLSIDCLQDE